jgi:hypothetical protein
MIDLTEDEEDDDKAQATKGGDEAERKPAISSHF